MKDQSGATLLEVVISMLLTAVIVSSVMSIALSAKKGGARSDRKLVANEASRELSAMLKNYVSADSNPATNPIPGPGTGSNTWSMTSGVVNDSCVVGNANCTCLNATSSQCYALSPGSHSLTGLLPGWFAGQPYNATITYFVSYPQTQADPSLVNITVSWNEP